MARVRHNGHDPLLARGCNLITNGHGPPMRIGGCGHLCCEWTLKALDISSTVPFNTETVNEDFAMETN